MFDPVQSTRYHRAIQSLTLPITLLFLYVGLNYEPQISLPATDYQENSSLWDKITTIHEIVGPNRVRAEHHPSTAYCPDLENDNETTDTTLLCIWGHIYYQGRPIEGAKVVVKLGREEIQTVTHSDAHDLEPYYRVYLPSPIEETLHITASFAKQSVTQSFHHVNTISTLDNGFSLGIASKGRWKFLLFNRKGVNKLAVTQDEKILLVGGSEGLTKISYDTPAHRALSEQTYNLFNEAEIRDLAIDALGEAWIVTENRIAIWQGSHWRFMDDPILDGIEWEALISNPDTGDMWAGGKRDNSVQGEIVFYDRKTKNWSLFASLEGPVTTLAIDADRHIWAGTWGSGLYEYTSEENWTRHLVDDGLPSNYIHVVYAQPQLLISDRHRSYPIAQAIWVGTVAKDANNPGGIGRYNPSQKIWKSYDISHGLPIQQNDRAADSEPQEELSEKTAEIYDILIDSRDGLVWAGTQAGLYIFSDETEGQERWSLHDPDLSDEVRALAFIQESLVVATTTSLHRLLSPTSNSHHSSIQPPSISIVPYRRHGQTELNGSLRHDQPSETLNPNIIAWHWVSNLDGLFCTNDLACPITHLRPGIHKITLQLQNSYGEWLPLTTTHLKLGHTTYMPIYRRQTISPPEIVR